MKMGFLKHLKKKWKYTLFLIVVALITYHFSAYLVAIVKNDINLSSMYVWKSHGTADFSETDIELLRDEYGEDNVTLESTPHVTIDLQVHAIESTFIENGVSVHHPILWNPIEQVELLYGDIWDAGTTDKVIVIDYSTAEKYFAYANVVGRVIEIDDQSWTIIGVVSDTSSRQAYYNDRYDEFGDEISIDDFDTDVYVPYFFHNYDQFDMRNDDLDGMIINTSKWISTRSDKERVLDLIAEGDNIIVMTDGTKLSVIGISTGSTALSMSVHTLEGYILTVIILFLLLFVIYAYNDFKTGDKITISEFLEDEISQLQSLSILKSQESFVKSIDEIIEVHNNNDSLTILFNIVLNTQVVGLCLIRLNDQHQNAFIWQFIIDERHQNKRVGSKALSKIINNLNKRFSYTITTTTKTTNINAKSLFENSGFTIFSEESDELNYRYKL